MYNYQLYIPRACVIDEIREEAPDIKTFRLSFREKAQVEGVDLVEETDFKPGQFVQVSVLGSGEAPISITSSPADKGYLELSVKRLGVVTDAIHRLKEGDELGIRGPYGNFFPIDGCKNRNILFVAGGIGLAPLRSFIRYAFANRDEFGRIVILYGARSKDDMVYKDELDGWKANKDTEVYLTIDTPQAGWDGNVGVVTTLFKNLEKLDNTKTFICGPPVMLPFVLKGLLQLGAKDENIIISLERYMKCGVGKCGHCYIGGKYVCLDGPVFTYAQIKEMEVEEAAGV